MNVVGKVGSLITQGVYSVATPFHPFGGAVDIIVVQQHDGSFRSTPWYVRFGKFQGVLNGAEKVVRIEVNGVECDVHMYLDSSGEAYFVKDAEATNGSFKLAQSFEPVQEDDDTSDHNYNETRKNHDDDISRQHCYDSSTGAFELRDELVALGMDRLERTDSDSERRLYDFEDVQSTFEGSAELSDYGSGRYDNLDMEHVLDSQISTSEVVLVSIDGYMITAPISSLGRHIEDVELVTPQFHLGPDEGANFSGPDTQYTDDEALQAADYLSDILVIRDSVTSDVSSSGSYSDIADQQLKICQGGGKGVEGTHDTSIHVREMQVGKELEHIPTRANKDDFCKSCLQLQGLTMQDRGLCQHDIGSSIENPEVAVDFQEAKDRQSGSLTIEHDVLSDSGTSISNTSTDVQFQVEAHQESVLEPDAIDTDRTSEHSILTNEEGEVNSYVINGEQVPKSKGESSRVDDVEPQTTSAGNALDTDLGPSMEISLCRNLLCAGMDLNAAAEAFDAHRISVEDYKLSMSSIIKNENLVVRMQGKYVPWDKAAPIILGLAVYGLKLPVAPSDAISVEQEGTIETNEASGISSTPAGRRWRLWPYGRSNTMEHASSQPPNKNAFTDSESASNSQPEEPSAAPLGKKESVRKPLMRTNVPTSEQIESLNLKEGQNMVTFISFSRVLGPQKVEAHIYLWKWNARIVISDVDGTITKSDVLGQFMPLVGKDWTHSGIARLFSAIKENGYQLLFLSARAIVQAYLTKSFLLNLNQDGKTLPVGPVVISPDGLFPSLYREVIRRAPHEFKIACLEDIKSLFPPDYNPFYAGFGNRDTDELSYRKIGIPRGKIFIINPKGEVAINRRIDVKSYSSLHTLVNDMFPPTSLVDEQEEFNPWNYWKLPLPDIEGL